MRRREAFAYVSAMLWAGLIYSAGAAVAAEDVEQGVSENWAIHGQVTIVEQYHPAFRSPYTGTNSLDPGSRGDETFDATGYLGVTIRTMSNTVPRDMS